MRSLLPLAVILASLTLSPKAQVVDVTLSLDTNKVAIGASTVLHVYAQIKPQLAATTDRIFSWYVDLVDTNATIARGDYTQLVRPASDKEQEFSSGGRTEEGSRRAIYDTFKNLANAGRTAKVELFSVPIVGVDIGTVNLRIQGGTTATNLSSDFIVAPAGGGNPLVGGDYSSASIPITVFSTGGAAPVRLSIGAVAQGRATISFGPIAAQNYTVEYKDDLNVTAWVPFNGSSTVNSGSFSITNSGPRRFFRVKSVPQ